MNKYINTVRWSTSCVILIFCGCLENRKLFQKTQHYHNITRLCAVHNKNAVLKIHFPEVLKQMLIKQIIFFISYKVTILSHGLVSIFETVTADQVSDCGSAFLFNFSVVKGHPTPQLLLVQIIFLFVVAQVCLKGEKNQNQSFPSSSCLFSFLLHRGRCSGLHSGFYLTHGAMEQEYTGTLRTSSLAQKGGSQSQLVLVRQDLCRNFILFKVWTMTEKVTKK